ncbi:MAG: ABC-type transport auxiliary lipoprotein family protein [Limisphaerales bacterium]
MNPPSDRRAFLTRTTLAAVGLGASWASGSGCGLRKEPLPTQTFVLKGPVSTAIRAGAGGPPPVAVLLVRPFKVATAFDSRSFVVRRSESEYVADAYHAFLVSPGAMFTDLVAEWARGLNLFSTVTTGGSQVVPTHALEADVTELYADYRDAASPKAVIAGQFRLLNPPVGARTGSTALGTVNGREEVGIPKKGAEELVAGWERGLGDWCGQLGSLLRERMFPAG